MPAKGDSLFEREGCRQREKNKDAAGRWAAGQWPRPPPLMKSAGASTPASKAPPPRLAPTSTRHQRPRSRGSPDSGAPRARRQPQRHKRGGGREVCEIQETARQRERDKAGEGEGRAGMPNPARAGRRRSSPRVVARRRACHRPPAMRPLWPRPPVAARPRPVSGCHGGSTPCRRLHPPRPTSPGPPGGGSPATG